MASRQNKKYASMLKLTRILDKMCLLTYTKNTKVNRCDATDNIRYFKSFNAKILKYIQQNNIKNEDNLSMEDIMIMAEDFVLFNTDSMIDMIDKYCSYNMFCVYVAVYIYIQTSLTVLDDDVEQVYNEFINLFINK